jgi:hypothetical protein
MNVGSWLVWGFAATVVLTAILAATHGAHLTRMNLPYMVGTMFTPSRDRAKIIGAAVHFVNGWIFSLVYVAAFHAWGGPAWWKGALVGAVHATFVLTAGMLLLPSMHPRMASDGDGPSLTRQLEPPGFLALNYGAPTPVTSLLAHVAFGLVLGAFYRPG